MRRNFMTRLEVILETIAELLEGEDRARTRSQSRKAGGSRVTNRRGTKERKELADKLRSMRQKDPFGAQMELDKATGSGWRMSQGAKYDPIFKSDFQD